jgi:hypothetical protein
MAGPAQPISDVFKGESRTFRLTVLDEDPDSATVIEGKTYTGSRVSLTGIEVAEWQVNYPAGHADPPVISKSLGAGILLDDQGDPDTKGDLLVTIDPADTADLVAKMYKHDLWIEKDGVRRCVIRPSDFPVREPINRP